MNNSSREFDVKEISGQEQAGLSPRKPRKTFKFQKKHFKILVSVLIVIALIIATAAFFRGRFSFSKDRVKLEISAPTEISSGSEVEFSISYLNNNRIALKDAKLIIDYPQGAYSLEGEELSQQIIDLERVLPKKEEIKDFKIRLTGEKGSIKLLSVRLNYQPESISSFFENSSIFKINIGSVLVEVYLTVPQKAISGEEIFYILDYLNNTDEDFSNLKIELKYPAGFLFKESDPEIIGDKNNTWQIDTLKKGERGTIKVSGILKGIEGENKTIEASISKIEDNKILKYSQTSAVTQISSSPLLILLSLNNEEEVSNINSGDKLNYKIEFKNNTDIALSQLILRAYIDSPVIDFKTLLLREKGFFDSLNNTITWSAAGVSALALLPPGELGEVSFGVLVKNNFPINNFDDKNFQISLRAELETLNVPPQFNLDKLKIEKFLETKVNTSVVLQSKGYYNETSVDIVNSGPIPPKVNRATTYTIHWQITNSSNDLEDVQVTAVLPQGIEWKNVYKTFNKNTELEYNERTKQIIWKVGKVPAATGFLIPAYKLVFQIALRPSINQIGQTPVLIDESSLTGKDGFTDKRLESFSPAIAANLPHDSSVRSRDGNVIE